MIKHEIKEGYQTLTATASVSGHFLQIGRDEQRIYSKRLSLFKIMSPYRVKVVIHIQVSLSVHLFFPLHISASGRFCSIHNRQHVLKALSVKSPHRLKCHLVLLGNKGKSATDNRLTIKELYNVIQLDN